MSIFISDENETRVRLEYDDAPRAEDLPFRLLLIGDWSGSANSAALGKRLPVEIDRDNFDDALRKMGIEISLDLSADNQDNVRLRLEELEDFHPDKIYRQVPVFADLRETRRRLADPRTFQRTAQNLRSFENSQIEKAPKKDSSDETSPEPENLLEQILSQAESEPEAKRNSFASESELDSLISRLVKPFLVNVNETEQAKLIAAVDEATGELMRKILHHPRFKDLESAWRAAYWLVTRVETGSNLKIYLFDATKEELVRDLKTAADLSESGFYKLLNDENSDSPERESWTAICANYEFKTNVDDAATLMRIAQIANISQTAFIAQASSEILGIEKLPDFLETADVKMSEDSAAGELWAMLRALPEASRVGLTFPRFLGRMPYGAKSELTEEFAFEEIAAPEDNRQYLWTNSSFVCALLLAQTFSSYEWEIGENLIRDVSGLPLYIYRNEAETIIKPLTETVVRVGAAEKIIEHGLMPLITFRDGDKIRLPRFQSIAAPPQTLKGKWNS